MSEIKVIQKGNIFDTKCQSIVCPVNVIGVLGAGLAKQFRDDPKFSKGNSLYKEQCMKGLLSAGSVYVYVDEPKQSGFTHVIYVASKFDWVNDSKLEYVENSLFNLYRAMDYYGINTCALPAIGCGLGNLQWATVDLAVRRMFQNDGYKNRTIEVYAPHDM